MDKRITVKILKRRYMSDEDPYYGLIGTVEYREYLCSRYSPNERINVRLSDILSRKVGEYNIENGRRFNSISPMIIFQNLKIFTQMMDNE